MSDLDREAIRAMRRSYGEVGLESLPNDPFLAFADWLKQAHENSFIVEANAMVLSTLDAGEQISTRTVLLKDISDGGFTFFTNYSWMILKLANPNLLNTLRRAPGLAKSVPGLARNLRRCHRAKS